MSTKPKAFKQQQRNKNGGVSMNTLIEKAIKEIKNQPKLTKEELTHNEYKAAELFDGKTIFESFK